MTQRAEYRRRKEAMHAALREHFGDIARWTDPEGGFFCWVTLDNGVDATELFEPALAEGVAFIPGSAFSPSGRFTDALRLCFASTPPDRIHEGRRAAAAGRRRIGERLTGVSVSAAERAVLDKIDEDRAGGADPIAAAGHRPEPARRGGGDGRGVGRGGRRAGLDVCETPVRPGRNNLRITLAGGPGPGLLLLGHTDVVPVGEGWTKDPFGGAVENGRIYGRGASDMKGGLAASLAAMAALRGAGLSGPVELAALVDEEETGAGIRAYVESVNARFVGCVTAEPTDLQTVVGARGASYLRVEIHGIACHAGNPGDGANAIYGAAAIVAEIERMHRELAQRPHPLLGPATWSVGQIHGGTSGSIVPAECVVVADRRLLPGESTGHRAGRGCATEWRVCGWAIAA